MDYEQLHPSPQPYESPVNTAIVAPTGSVKTEKRPIPGKSEGLTHTVAPSSTAFAVVMSTSSTLTYPSQAGVPSQCIFIIQPTHASPYMPAKRAKNGYHRQDDDNARNKPKTRDSGTSW